MELQESLRVYILQPSGTAYAPMNFQLSEMYAFNKKSPFFVYGFHLLKFTLSLSES